MAEKEGGHENEGKDSEREQGEFQVERMLGGEYVLTDGQYWRLRVRLEDGRRLAMELTPDNSVKVRDDFPSEAN